MRKPGNLVWIAAVVGFAFAAVADATDGDQFDLWLWGGTVATVWALTLAIGIWFLTAADTKTLLARLDKQDAQIQSQRKQLTQLVAHAQGGVRTAAGHIITAGPSSDPDAQMVRVDISLLEERLLRSLEAKTGVTPDQVRDGQKVYDTGSDTDPWVLTAKDGRQWLVTAEKSGRPGIVNELLSSPSLSKPGDSASGEG